MTFVDLIIERHSCDRALKRAVSSFGLSSRVLRAWLNLADTCDRRGEDACAAWAARNALRLDQGKNRPGNASKGGRHA